MCQLISGQDISKKIKVKLQDKMNNQRKDFYLNFKNQEQFQY
jgi:ATP-dependent Lon protease